MHPAKVGRMKTIDSIAWGLAIGAVIVVWLGLATGAV